MVVKYLLVIIVFLLIRTESMAQTEQQIDSLEQMLLISIEEDRLGLLNELCALYAPRDAEKSMKYAKEGVQLSRSLNNLRMKAKFLSSMGILFRRNAEYDSAAYYYQASLTIANEVLDSVLIVNLHNNLGYLFKEQGEIEKAIQYYKRAIELSDEYAISGKDMVLINIGNIYKKQGKEGLAMDNFMKALEYYEEINDDRGRARVYNNLNLLFRDFDKLEDAMHYAQMALEINTKIEDKRGMAISYNNIAIIYDIKEETEEAIRHFTKAYELADELGLRTILLSIVGNLGQAYVTLGNQDKALFYFQKSLQLSVEAGYLEGVVHGQNNIGMIHLDNGNYSKAILNFKESLVANLQGEYIDMDMAATAHKNLSMAYEKTGDYKFAFIHRLKGDSISDQLQTNEQASIVEEMKVKYETEKNEAEKKFLAAELSASESKNALMKSEADRKSTFIWAIGSGASLSVVILIILIVAYRQKRKRNLILQLQNEKIEKQRNDVVKLSATKDKLLSVVAHDLKNPLGILQSISRMLVEKYDTLSDDHKKEIAKTMYGSFNSTYELVENLLQWSQSQTKGLETIPERIEISNLIQKNIALVKLLAENKNIKLEMEIEENLNVFADVNMINTVCRNLITNAIKFTNQGGKVVVKAKGKNEDVEIIVEDTGIGIKQDELEKLFKIETNTSKIGNSPEKGTGLGLVLCHDFIEANGGVIKMDSELGKGSAVKFTLRKAV